MPAGTSLAALLWLSAASSGTPPSAPLGVRTQGTLRELFLDMTLADARAADAAELELRWSMANDWSAPTLLTRGGRQVELQTDEQADTLGISLAAAAGRWVFLLEDRLLTPAFEAGWHVAEPQGSYGLQASAAFATLRPHNQVTIGVRHAAFTFWASEDFTPGPNFGTGAGWFYDSNAPDVALGLACRLAL